MNFDVAGQRRVRGQFRRLTFRREFASRRAIEVVELTLDGVELSVSSCTVPLVYFGLAARELHVALRGRLCDDLLSLLERHANA